MSKLAIGLIGLGLATAMPLAAQQMGESGMEERRPPSGEEHSMKTEALTTTQMAQVKAILSKYDANALTADQAKAIHEAFRETGVRGGPAMNETIRAAGFDPDQLRDLAPPPGRMEGENDTRRSQEDAREPGDQPSPDADAGLTNKGGQPGKGDKTGKGGRGGKGGQGKYNLEQAISDRAQLNTIAFSGLAFLTGDFGAATFMPPGKVCDYFGFQYMRDIDAAEKGHNPMFLSRVAANVMHILNEDQRKLFEDLATEQSAQFEQLALKRMPLIKAFHRERDGDIPKGSTGLSREAVIRYVGDFFAFDAELSYRRTEVFGKVVSSLTPDQKAYLGKMKFGDFNTWPELDERSVLKRPSAGASKFYNVAYMTYASEFFSWYAGSVMADTYFCPERHGTYFGGFYMKDMPAMGKRNYDISTSVTGDSGENFLMLLNANQRENITSIIARQRQMLSEMVKVREAISTELRKFLSGGKADKQKVLALGRHYGELDGEVSWMYASAFAKVNRTLTKDQRTAMIKLRNLDGYQSAPAYLYSSPMQKLPEIPNTDFLFGVSATPQTGPVPPVPPSPAPAAPASKPADARTGFILKSSEVTDGGPLPKDFTGDGTSSTLPIEWSGAPAGTKDYGLVMHHVDREGKIKWYWILYNIPADTKSLPKNVKNVGTLGNNSVNGRTEYAPPHSKGPGAKTYIYTLYALSAPVTIDAKPSGISRDALLAAMKDRTLAAAELRVVYSRPEGSTDSRSERREGPPEQPDAPRE